MKKTGEAMIISVQKRAASSWTRCYSFSSPSSIGRPPVAATLTILPLPHPLSLSDHHHQKKTKISMPTRWNSSSSCNNAGASDLLTLSFSSSLPTLRMESIRPLMLSLQKATSTTTTRRATPAFSTTEQQQPKWISVVTNTTTNLLNNNNQQCRNVSVSAGEEMEGEEDDEGV